MVLRAPLLLIERARFRIERELAHAWVKRNPQQLDTPSSDKVLVRFAIPLVSKTNARNWDQVEENLSRTIDALRRQTSHKWEATIIGQSQPNSISFDGKIRFCRYSIAPRKFVSDKSEKLRTLIRHISRTDNRDGYIFFLDADDIPHPNLVKYIITDNNGHGYYLPQGYIVDFGNKKVAGLGIPPNVEHEFHLCNGSTNALRFDLRKNRSHVIPAIARGPHMDTAARVRAFGLHLKRIPYPAMLYVFNHGNNLAISRGRGKLQLQLLAESAGDAGEFDRVLREFGVVSSNKLDSPP